MLPFRFETASTSTELSTRLRAHVRGVSVLTDAAGFAELEHDKEWPRPRFLGQVKGETATLRLADGDLAGLRAPMRLWWLPVSHARVQGGAQGASLVGTIRPSAFGTLLIGGAIWVISNGPAWAGTLTSVRGMLRLAVVAWIVWRLGGDYVRLWQALRQLAKAG